MSYRAPYFYSLHAIREAGAVTLAGDAAEGGFPEERLWDSRIDSLFKFDGTTAGNDVTVDRGAGSLVTLDTTVIPIGHNLNGCTIRIDVSATGSFSGEEDTVFGPTAIATDALLELSWASGSALRHVQTVFETAGTVWSLAELMHTTQRLTTIGPLARIRDDLVPSMFETSLVSGLRFRVEKGDPRLLASLTFRGVPEAERAALYDLLFSESSSFVFPIWYASPEDGDVIRYMFVDRMGVEQDSPAPQQTGLQWQIELELAEALA